MAQERLARTCGPVAMRESPCNRGHRLFLVRLLMLSFRQNLGQLCRKRFFARADPWFAMKRSGPLRTCATIVSLIHASARNRFALQALWCARSRCTCLILCADGQ
jgi:hypothetical protein